MKIFFIDTLRARLTPVTELKDAREEKDKSLLEKSGGNRANVVLNQEHIRDSESKLFNKLIGNHGPVQDGGKSAFESVNH